MEIRKPCDLYTMVVSSRYLPFTDGQDDECPHGCVFEKCANSAVCGPCDKTSKSIYTAESRPGEDCGVCYERVAEQVKLPTCSHSLCVHCYWRMYDARTYGDGKRGVQARCPFCRVGTWIQDDGWTC